MFWPIKRSNKEQSRRSKKLRWRNSRRLFLESLEQRQLLAGIVNISWPSMAAGFPPNTLLIQGDNQANNVVISQNAGASSYSISRPADDTTTEFVVNGVGPVNQPDPITLLEPGGFGDIVVDLGPDADTFVFNNALQSPGSNSNVFGNLSIKNDGADTNNIMNVTTAGALQIFDDNPADYLPGAAAAGLPARPAGVTAAANGANTTNTLTDVIVGTDLVINTNGGSNNTITSTSITPPPSMAPGTAFPAPTMVVNGGLWVTAIAEAVAGQNSLTISNNSFIIGPTVVTNAGGGGSNTTIVDSTLRGGVPANNPPSGIPTLPPAFQAYPQDGLGTGIGLQIENDYPGPGTGGMDVVKIQGRSVIGGGTTPAAGAAPFSQTAVYINNRSGGSMTTLGKARADDLNTVQVLGGLKIANGDNVAGVLDVTSIDQTNVFGGTYIYNAGSTGGTSTTVTNSTLGSSLATSPAGTPAPVGPLGNPFVLINDAGADSFTSMNANFPWGVYINNDDMGGGATSTFTHVTDISGGTIGRIGGAPSAAGFVAGPTTLAAALADPGLAPAAAGPLATGGLTSANDALFIGGGGFKDIVNIGLNSPSFGTDRPPAVGTPTQIYGDANINLGAAGTNFVTMIGQSTGTAGQPINGVSILGGAGADDVWIQNFTIQANVFIALDGNAPIVGPPTLTSPLGTVFGSIDTLNLKTTTTLPGMGGTVFVTGGAAVSGVAVDDLLAENIVIDPGVTPGLALPPGFFFL